MGATDIEWITNRLYFISKGIRVRHEYTYVHADVYITATDHLPIVSVYRLDRPAQLRRGGKPVGWRCTHVAAAQ